MSHYTPRRAGKRWQESAPSYVLDVLDNGGKTADRYTVIFGAALAFHTDAAGAIHDGPGDYGRTWLQYLAMSDAPTHPQGFSQCGELSAYDAASYRRASQRHRIRWLDLPEHIREHVIARASPENE